MTGQPPTRTTQSTYLRSDFRHRMRPSGLNLSKLLSFPLCAVRPHRTVHRASLTITRSIRSTFENCHESFTYSKSILIRDERTERSLLEAEAEPRNRSRGSVHHLQLEMKHRALPSVLIPLIIIQLLYTLALLYALVDTVLYVGLF